MSLRGVAAVVGVAELPPRRESPGETGLGLIGRVAAEAVRDAGLEPGAVDGLFVGTQVGETPQHVGVTVAEYLGLAPRVAELVDLGGASGPGMVWRAAAAIQAGMCTTALCVLSAARDPGRPLRATNRNPIREHDVPHGASGANTSYAWIAQRYLHEFRRSPADLALVPVLERRNAMLNPDAIFHGREITVEDVLASPMISDPLHLLDIVMPCAGAAAVVVTSAAATRWSPHWPVLLRGAGERVTHRAVSQAPTLTSSPLRAAIADAYAMAGVGPGDLDVLSLYDCYSVLVLVTLEDAGLCAPGTAADWLADHDVSHRGEVSLNPHGGQLACGQADLAGGMGHVVEAVRQLRGGAGERQMADPRLALVTGNGATMGEEVALVLEAAG
ncbi:thiolase family protein [Phycicoccus sp. BSK3Z-2]|uniref:Thiolase family protein n=1 Tax=Phycicoccus avicenniae TaxID=2828860 RepID=A0A941I154_9MICO|nr:thiolase family protein [Phycicoccus avicenniae]MBR7744817.1 thiolase family protein [Phycicoccus avicenniae]